MRYYLWQGALMVLRLICVTSQPSIGFMALAISGANDFSYASSFVKQVCSQF